MSNEEKIVVDSGRTEEYYGKNFKFSFQRMRNSINFTLNPMYQQPLTKPHTNYVYGVVKERKSQTLYDIWVGLGWRSNEKSIATFEIHSSVGMEIGRLINFHLPKRDFKKVEINIYGEKMSVREYNWYEVPFIVSLIFAYFDLFQYIPSHWKYGFYINTNIHSMLYNLSATFPNMNDKLKKIMNDSILTQKLQNMMIQEFADVNVIDKSHIFKYYRDMPLYRINAKYGVAIELFVIQNMEQILA